MFVELMDKRKKHFARLKAEEWRRKPPTKAQKRSQIFTYLKHMVGYKQNQLKSKNYDEIQKLFDKSMTRVNMFVDMDTKLVKESSKKVEMAQESCSKRAGDELEQEKAKKQKIDDDEVEMKNHMEIVPDDEVAINAIPIATKPPIIIDWKIIKEGNMGHFQIIRADGMIKMLQSIDREDLETLWKLVKAKHENTMPEEGYEIVLWGDLKVMFEPDVESKCMTRSSTKELFTPYKEPEREFRSSRRHFKTLSLDELRSPDFNLLFDQEYSEEEVAETMAETMEQ
ncbi:hypothetical protein Tco_0236086 [Tanacetum coccineum]